MPVDSWVSTESWEVVYLGGKRMPGVASVEISMPSGLDVQKGTDKKRARVVDRGSHAARVEIALILLPEEMADLEAVLPTLRPRGATQAHPALEIAHPNAKLWGVNVVKIAEIDSPMPSTGGTYVLKVKAIEHIEKPKAVTKPPKTEAPKGGWNNVQGNIDALNTSPAQSGGPEANFSSEPPIEGSGF